MKKWIAIVFLLVLVLSGCGKRNTYRVQITVPAGSEKSFYISEEQISATGRKVSSFIHFSTSSSAVLRQY